MEGTNDSFEILYLTAAEKGDSQAVEFALSLAGKVDVNAKDSKGRLAIHLAIIGRHADVLRILLQYGVDVGDALLLAVECQFYQGVHIICEFARHQQDGGHSIIHCQADSEDFHPDVTPIILAAHQNSYDIIKLLLQYGAYIEDPKTGAYVTENDTLEHSLGMLNVFRALSSEAYISLTEEDPIDRAFKLSVRLRVLSHREYEFRQDYEALSARCEEFAAALLGHTRNTEEQTAILTHHDKLKYQDNIGRMDRLPRKAFQAMDMEQKKFVAHPHCQELLTQHWYAELNHWRKKSFWGYVVRSIGVCLTFPFCSIGYLLMPVGSCGHFMRTPYVKFLMHLASFITFLVLLYLSAEDIGRTDPFFKEYIEYYTGNTKLPAATVSKLFTQRRGRYPDAIELAIFAWIVGMTWREAKEAWESGFWRYTREAWNIMDFAMMALFWAWISLRVTAIVLIQQEIARTMPFDLLEKRAVNDSLWDNVNTTQPGVSSGGPSLPADATVIPVGLGVNAAVVDTNTLITNEHIETRRQTNQVIDIMESTVIQNLTDVMEKSCKAYIMNLTTIMSTYITQASSNTNQISYTYTLPILTERKNWNQWDPTLVSELLFSLASVLSVLRLIQMLVISEIVGPMQISLTKMVYDILRFLFIFTLVWLAFALGMTQVYWSYSVSEQLECLLQGNAKCNEKAFGSFKSSLATLFWSLFGLSELANLKVNANHKSTEDFGMMLYGFYYVVAVVVLLNLIIAVMSSTYTRIEENADTEWKFSRSQMWIEYFRKSTLAPPFNIIPSPKFVITGLRSLYYTVRRQAAQKRIQKNREKVKKKEQKYLSVVRQLTLRYFAEKKSSSNRESDDGCISSAEFVNFKDDMSEFRSEVFAAVQRLEKSLASSQNDNLRMFRTILKLQEVLTRAECKDTEATEEIQARLLRRFEDAPLQKIRPRYEQDMKEDLGSDMCRRMKVQLRHEEEAQPPSGSITQRSFGREPEADVLAASMEPLVASHVVDVHNSPSETGTEETILEGVSSEDVHADFSSTNGASSEMVHQQFETPKRTPSVTAKQKDPVQRESEDVGSGSVSPMYQLFEKLISGD